MPIEQPCRCPPSHFPSDTPQDTLQLGHPAENGGLDEGKPLDCSEPLQADPSNC